MNVSFAQNFEDVMLWRALKHVPNGFYIDVGANDPSVDSVTKLFYERGWNGINIEPLGQHFLDLQRARSRDINLQCAAGAVAGSIDIWECGVRGWATAEKSVVQEHLSKGRTGQYLKVPMCTLTEICQLHAPTDIHFLKIDVEGFERAVLEGMDFTRFRPWIVVVEATRPNSTLEVHGEWEGLITGQQYDFVYADGLNRFYLARERSALAPALVYPPNFFDDFLTSARVDAEERAVLAETCLDQALALAAQADARVKHADARATQAELRVATLLDSTSWRIMAPFRLLAGLKPRWANRGYLAPGAMLHRVVGYVASRPEVRMRVARWLNRVPALKRRVKKFAGASGANARDALEYLPPRIRSIYTQLTTPPSEHTTKSAGPSTPHKPSRLRLAYVSPLPPQPTGIASYSADLLPALLAHYDIDVIVVPTHMDDPCVVRNCGIRSTQWFLENSYQYDRVLYHFGNSSYHQHMFEMVDKVPGVVVLHDFFLGGVLGHIEQIAPQSFAMTRALYVSHGYTAFAERSLPNGAAITAGKYPANFRLLQCPHGVIVHSLHARGLASHWYGPKFSDSWSVIPLVRTPQRSLTRDQARLALGLTGGDFLVCSFGVMSFPKLNHRLLASWLESDLAQSEACMLVFVGEEHAGEYGRQIKRTIDTSPVGRRIRILGWSDADTFTNYLAAADMAVQLRTHSRGESSAAVLDCMNHGVATVVNAHGSFSELPGDAVWMLPDLFDNSQLTDALEALWRNPSMRVDLGAKGRAVVWGAHAPQACATQYSHAIERGYVSAGLAMSPMLEASLSLRARKPPETELIALAQSLGDRLPARASARQWLVDVSGTCRSDPKTGIQRVVRALVWELIHNPPAGCRVEPVYLTDHGGKWHYRYARAWTSKALGCDAGWMPDDPVEFFEADLLLVADFISELAAHAERDGVYAKARQRGASIHFVVYDLLPLKMPHCFPPGQFGYSQWLDALARVADGVLCISESVAQDLRTWLAESGPKRSHPLLVDSFHLGADIQRSIPTVGVDTNAREVLLKILAAPSFLMVGTLEPRKGYLQCLKAFSLLWEQGCSVNLVIVGAEGWRGMPDNMRRTIPDIMNCLRSHPELGNRLIWLDGVSDEYLERVYAASTCLIAASEGEGFGLPLIEAAQHKIPIIARDIPVFREVAGPHAHYFRGLDAKDLADAINAWMQLRQSNQLPDSTKMPWRTWAQSTQDLVQKLNAPEKKGLHAIGV